MNDIELRQLDKKVAQAIGYWAQWVNRFGETHYWRLIDPHGSVVTPIGANNDKFEAQVWELVPYFSTNLEHAWNVVTHLQSKGYQVFIETGFADEEDGPSAGITKKRGLGIEGIPYCDIIETAETVPLAICLVALKAANIED